MERVLAEAGLRPNIAMRLASTDDVRRLLEIGLGIGSVARISAEREIAAGHLRTLNTAPHFARAATAALD
jgi:DNA-binding transcriptional LysR family regulator